MGEISISKIEQLPKKDLGDGKFYQGETNPITKFKEGFGKFTWPNGTYFLGFFKDDEKHGMGIETGKYISKINGKECNSIYEGQQVKDIKHGIGKQTFIEDEEVYVGGWANDLRNGYGKNIWQKDGNVYEGFWKQGLREGHGRFYFKDGRIFDGFYKNDKKHGIVTFIDIDGTKE